jgi:hypothetical protein
MLFVYGLCNEDITSPDYIGLGNDDTETMWKEVVVIYYKILSRSLDGGAGENHKEICQESRVFRPIFKPNILRI